MNPKKKRQIQVTLKRLAESHAAMMAFLEETLSVLSTEFDLDGIAPASASARHTEPQLKAGHPHLDYGLRSIIYADRRCFLGNTLPFKLMDRLVRRPNQYISNEQLLEEVWLGIRSKAAVRSVVKVLRSKLRESGLGRVADAIDGQVAGHYALMLNRL